VNRVESIRAAIVGCGRISDLHQLGYRDRSDARIVAVCDSDRERAAAKAAAWGAQRVYTDLDQVLDDREVNLVELLTPHHLHGPMTVAVCQAGKHVSVQKPMALSASEAQQMIDAADHAGVMLRIYENFVYYEPAVRARQMIEADEIGEVRAIRMHISTGTSSTGWEVPLSAWMWRFDEKKCGGGPLVFDHGYHLFSLAHFLGGPVERVYAWIDTTPAAPGADVDAPAVVMFQFHAPRCYGVLDVEHTPQTVIDSDYYADDDRVEVIGDKGILFINRYTARTVDLPELMLFKGGKTTAIPIRGAQWHDSFIAATRDLLEKLPRGEQPRLDGPTGKSVLQFCLAALQSARAGQEVRPSEVA
jgi:predicted dehydrogenase